VTAVNVIVALLMIAGVIGAVVPFLPGAPLIVAGAVIYAIATDFTPIGVGRLSILAGLGAAGWAAAHLVGVLGARRAGGGRAAVIGALIGAVVGLAFAPLGLLLGPVAGAIAGEMLVGRSAADSVRTGIGTALGVVIGVAVHVAFAVAMVTLFAWWVWRGSGLS